MNEMNDERVLKCYIVDLYNYIKDNGYKEDFINKRLKDRGLSEIEIQGYMKPLKILGLDFD